MKLHLFSKGAAIAAALASWVVTGEANAITKPNFLIILADDMGYSDAGCYGSEIHTPNLDHLAATGLRFTQFYNTARCWSSRAALLSGYYPQAIRRDELSGDFKPEVAKGDRPRWAQLLPELLKPLGYRSYHSGKWHIDSSPMESSFDRSFDHVNANNYFEFKAQTEDGKKIRNSTSGENYYSTIYEADEAIKFLKDHATKHADRPFLEYLAFHAPHFPLQALPEDIAIYKDTYKAGWDVIRSERLARMKKLGIVDPHCDLSPLDPITIPRWNAKEALLRKKIGPDEVGHAVPWNSLTNGQKDFQAAKMSVHAAMVHRMDIEIGRVLDQLKAMGALDNTVVFFLSDNGASAEQIIRGGGHDPSAPIGSEKTFLGMGPGWASAANTPLRLYKSWNHEGGISTPLIVNWPAGIKADRDLRTTPGHLIDIVPTVLDLAGGKQPEKVAGLTVPPLQGKSLVPAFSKDGSITREYFWWNHDGNRAIRMGDWKLVADHKKPWELYDLSKDRSETKNLADRYPPKISVLEKAWMQHSEEFHQLALQDPPAHQAKKKPGKNAVDDE